MLAGIGGALTIAFSAILVRLADESPTTAAVFRCLLATITLPRRRVAPFGGLDTEVSSH